MVSRRKILSRSRDNLSIDQDEEDVWYQKDKLFKVIFSMGHIISLDTDQITFKYYVMKRIA